MEEVSSEVRSQEVEKKLLKKMWVECNIYRTGKKHLKKLIDSNEVDQ